MIWCIIIKNKNKVKIIMYISIGQAAKVIGVSISTLRRWEDEGFFKCDFRTKGSIPTHSKV